MRLLIFLLIPSLSYALTFEECSESGRKHARSVKHSKINPKCGTIISEQASITSKEYSEEAGLKVSLHKNMIFIQNEKEDKNIFIAGDQTQLQESHFVELDAKNKSIVVIANEDKAILNFEFRNGGNISPTRTLRSPELKSASSLLIDNENEHLIVIHESNSRLVFYNRFADDNGRTERFLNTVLGELGGPQTLLKSPLDGCIDNDLDELFIYDEGLNKVLVFPRGIFGDITPKRVISKDVISGQKMLKINCLSDKKQLVLINEKKELIYLDMK